MRLVEKKPKKPSACNPCKAGRIMCHPQPGGAPCPRCVAKNTICTTTPVPRGRPRKNPPPSSSSLTPPETLQLVLHPVPKFGTSAYDCPDLSPEFVSHCFEEIRFDPRYGSPLIAGTSIRADVRAASFQLDLLPPQSRVLALCMVAYGSLWSFHPSVLGEGPHPESFLDYDFFSSRHELLTCGVRRAPAYRALRAEALKAAWEIGIILVPSNENAASCYLLDLMDQNDFCSAGRPWATAYIAHIRALAPIWWAESYSILGFSGFSRWTGVLMAECLVSMRNRTALVVTPQDQLLLCGSEPPPLEILIESLQRAANDSIKTFSWASLRPYLFHVTTLCRQLSDEITGEFARTRPLCEDTVRNFLGSLSKVHSILDLLFDHIARANGPGSAAYFTSLAFSGMVLPLYRELQYREKANNDTPPNQRARERWRTLRVEAHNMAVLGGRALARGLRCLAKIHYLPYQWAIVCAWAEFVADEADEHTPSGSMARDLETFANELKLLGYSLDFASAPQTSGLIERLDKHVDRALDALF